MKLIILFVLMTSIIKADFISDLIIEISNKSDLYKMNRINTEINAFKYKSDKTIYKVNDYWATPEEFLANKGGDCEDYSIAKAEILKQSGFMGNIAFGLSQDKKHIVLLVEVDSEIYILDNQCLFPKKFNNEFKIVNYEKLILAKKS